VKTVILLHQCHGGRCTLPDVYLIYTTFRDLYLLPPHCWSVSYLSSLVFKLSWMKVNLSRALTEHHTMKACWGMEVQLHAFLTTALDGGEWPASQLGAALSPGKEPPVTHWIGDLVGPRTGLDTVVKRKIPSPCRDSNTRSSSLYTMVVSPTGSSNYPDSFPSVATILKIKIVQV
jgi:hypothetical protein